LENLSKRPPMNIHLLLLNHQHQRSHIVTASTQDTFLYHRFILSVLCYSSFLHWYDGPIYMLRPSESLLANNQLTIIIEWFRINIASSPTINPIQGFSIIEISCLFLYWVKSFSFQIFNLFLRSEREFLWLNNFFLRFSTLIKSTMHLRILRIRSDLQTRKYSVSFRI